MKDLGLDSHTISEALSLTKIFTRYGHLFTQHSPDNMRVALESLFASNDVQRFLGVHSHNNILWFNKEAFETFIAWIFLIQIIIIIRATTKITTQEMNNIATCYTTIAKLQEISIASGFKWEKFSEMVKNLHINTRKAQYDHR
jgi:hypothetical protein